MHTAQLRRKLVGLVLRANRVPALQRLNQAPYDLCLRALAFTCGRLPGLQALYVQRDYATGGWTPGSSDVDICVVLRPLPAGAEPEVLRRLWRALGALQRVFPFLSTGYPAVPVYDEADLAQPEFGWMAVPLHERVPPARWTLVWGREVRPLIRSWTPAPPRPVPVAPDLHQLVDKYIHRPQIQGRVGNAPYVGSEVRLALKLLDVLLSQQDGGPPADARQTLQRLRQGPLDPGGELSALLADLRRSRGFVQGGEAGRRAVVRRLGLALWRLQEAYYRRLLAQHPPAGARAVPRAAAYDAARLAQLPAGCRQLLRTLAEELPALRFAVAAPRSRYVDLRAPHHLGQLYGIYLVLPVAEAQAYEQCLDLLARVHARQGPAAGLDPRLKLDFRVLGPEGWRVLLLHCASHFVLEGAHLHALGAAWPGREPVPWWGPPAADTLRLALARRLAHERCQLLRSDPAPYYLGQPLAWYANHLLNLMSYRLYLAQGRPLTLRHEILEAYEARYGAEAGARAALDLCSQEQWAPATARQLARVQACAREVRRACARRLSP